MSNERINPGVVKFLYTEIGRGHPFYLDGIVESLERLEESGVSPVTSSVFDHTRGLSAIAWRSARWLYQVGSSGGPLGWVYSQLRKARDYNESSKFLSLLGRDIERHFGSESVPLVVAHPILTSVLSGRENFFYQHGEVAVPREALVRGATAVFVPTEATADLFLSIGYGSDQVIVSGLCIEPSLCDLADVGYHGRQTRLSSDTPLTGLYMSSGAESRQHVIAIIESITSIRRGGGKAVVLARRGGRLQRLATEFLAENASDCSCCDNPEEVPVTEAGVILALYDSRRQETEFTERLFERIDYLVAPAHERTNWALGLGLPMFPLVPSIGPFAPLNLRALTEAGVAVPLDTTNPPARLGQLLQRLREDGSLQKMCKTGWGKYDIDGFAKIARFLTGR